jgi:protein transport protein SEC24
LFIGGRILAFASNICTSGSGALSFRDDAKLYNTDKEKVLLSPVNDHYVKMAKECVQSRICVDLFYAANQYKSMDITSIAPIASLTGGDFHFYCPFDINKHGEKLHYEIFRNITRA